MGALYYGEWVVEFDDRLLTHLQVAIVNRLRRGESLLMSWVNSVEIGSGRQSLWISPAVPLRFSFVGSRTPAIDPVWVHRLDQTAASPTGLIVVDVNGRPIAVTASSYHYRSFRPNVVEQPVP